MDLKALPNDILAEQEVLSTILSDHDKLIEVIEILRAEDFYNTANKIIFEAMIELYSSDIPIDTVILANKLKGDRLEAVGGITYIAELMNGGLKSTNITNYAKIVKEKSDRRKLIQTARSIISEAFNEQSEVREIINITEDKLLNIGVNTENKVLTDEMLLSKTLEEIEKNYKAGGDITGMSTGYKSLDMAINGIVKKDLLIIAGRPSMGKTCLALNIASNLIKNNKVALFELEMSAEKLGARRLAAATFTNATRLPRGKIDDKEWEKIIFKANEMIERNNMFTDTTAGISMNEIKGKCKKIKLKHGLDVVIIDHIGLVTPSNSKDTRVNQISEITRQAKIMAKELDISVILLSQLSRAVEARNDKRPMMSDLRESGSIEQDADLIIFVYRDEYYNPNTDEKDVMECIIAKQRDGRTGTIKLAYKPEYQLVSEIYR